MSAPTVSRTNEGDTDVLDQATDNKFDYESIETLPDELKKYLEPVAKDVRGLYTRSLQALEIILERTSTSLADFAFQVIGPIMDACIETEGDSIIDDEMRFEAVKLYIKVRGLIWPDFDRVYRVSGYVDRKQLSLRFAALIKDTRRNHEPLFNTMAFFNFDADNSHQIQLAYTFVFLTVCYCVDVCRIFE